ncbi:chemotaxis protein CheW [uncultured Ferrovibrio sp.]|jgi:purine-binding chemotaxis protein CheW|uniref:chemotaxis protein CheW n=1 Tax=uncultured Ferrovibrio sp. TaxID=1576913 RepID=UPI0026099986|nr:chemotaxis protein CheW [uncultured Ferrovibrio sp.]
MSIPATMPAGNDAKAAASQSSQEVLTFTIDDQNYGLDLLTVREIRAWTEVTPLPNTPPFVRGVINLRGAVVPIFDLRVRLGGGVTQPTSANVVIVVEIGSESCGLLVDTVSDILALDPDSLQPVPATATANTTDEEHTFLSALATHEERMVALIDVNRLFSRGLPQLPAAA